MVAGLVETRVEVVETTDRATDLARGLRAGLGLDLGLVWDEDGFASSSSISTSVSDDGSGAMRAFLDVRDRVRTLL